MDEKLKIRIRTATVFAIVMLAGIYINKYSAIALLAVIAVGCTYEYTRITRSGSSLWTQSRWYAGLAGYITGAIAPQDSSVLLLLLCLTFTLAGIVNLYTRRRLLHHDRLGSLLSLLYLGLPLGVLSRQIWDLHMYSPLYLLSILGFIWMSDTAAYLVGSRIGKRKLLPHVSPNKTWEGTLGAGVACLLLALTLHFTVGYHSLTIWISLAVATWTIGSYGDLVESSIKRQYGIKDSGSFMPGHGGFLDRFDSFVYVVPAVLLLLHYLKS